MKKNSNHVNLFITLGMMIITACSTPKLADYAAQTNLSKKVKYDHSNHKVNGDGRGYTIRASQLSPFPKRIALVSYFGTDPGSTEKGQNSRSTYCMTKEGIKVLSNQFYATSIGPLKDAFRKNNMELLTPDEFLKTEDQKKYYSNFSVEHTSLNNLGAGIMKGLTNAGSWGTGMSVKESADGYSIIDIKNDYFSSNAKQNLNGSQDSKMLTGVGADLCKALGVDAVVVMYISVASHKKNYSLQTASLYMLGPNMVMESTGKEKGFFYSKGVFYCGTRLWFKKPLLINQNPKKIAEDQLKSDNNKAVENISLALVQKMEEYFKDGK